jgi:hypothetical protein
MTSLISGFFHLSNVDAPRNILLHLPQEQRSKREELGDEVAQLDEESSKNW